MKKYIAYIVVLFVLSYVAVVPSALASGTMCNPIEGKVYKSATIAEAYPWTNTWYLSQYGKWYHLNTVLPDLANGSQEIVTLTYFINSRSRSVSYWSLPLWNVSVQYASCVPKVPTVEFYYDGRALPVRAIIKARPDVGLLAPPEFYP